MKKRFHRSSSGSGTFHSNENRALVEDVIAAKAVVAFRARQAGRVVPE